MIVLAVKGQPLAKVMGDGAPPRQRLSPGAPPHQAVQQRGVEGISGADRFDFLDRLDKAPFGLAVSYAINHTDGAEGFVHWRAMVEGVVGIMPVQLLTISSSQEKERA